MIAQPQELHTRQPPVANFGASAPSEDTSSIALPEARLRARRFTCTEVCEIARKIHDNILYGPARAKQDYPECIKNNQAYYNIKAVIKFAVDFGISVKDMGNADISTIPAAEVNPITEAPYRLTDVYGMGVPDGWKLHRGHLRLF